MNPIVLQHKLSCLRQLLQDLRILPNARVIDAALAPYVPVIIAKTIDAEASCEANHTNVNSLNALATAAGVSLADVAFVTSDISNPRSFVKQFIEVMEAAALERAEQRGSELAAGRIVVPFRRSA